MAALGSAATLARTTSGKGVSGSATGILVALVVGGSALAQIGLIVCSPALVGLAGRLSGLDFRCPSGSRCATRLAIAAVAPLRLPPSLPPSPAAWRSH